MSDSFVSSLSSAAPASASRLEGPVQVLKSLTPHPDVTAAPLSAPQPGAQDPDAILRNMELPNDVRTMIEPVLAAFGMHLEIKEREEYPIELSTMHVAVNDGLNLFLLHFDSSVLEDARWAKYVMLRGYLFRAGEQVRILSKDCQDLDPAYVLAWRAWTSNQVATEYVEWRGIAQLAKVKEEQRPDLLHQALRLPPTVQPRSAPREPQQLLEDASRLSDLVTVLARYGQSSGSATVSAFINDRLSEAALPQPMRLERAVWPDNYPAAARDVIAWLSVKGRDPGRPGYSYLATVLVTLLDNVGADDRRFLIETMKRYSMVSVDAELQKLQTKYLSPGG